ncbi:MAG TPA: hypothetical protein VGK63_10910 [Candidatus Limnocylindrales bacterium]
MPAGALAGFYAWCARLPLPGWWLFPAMSIVLFAWAHALLWGFGRLSVETFDPTVSVSVVYGPYVLGVLQYLNGVAIVGSDVVGRVTYGAASAPIATFGYATLLIVVAHTTRQLRLVAKIHRQARAIDPFDRGPVYAFSRFTAQIGLAFLLTCYYTLTVNSSFQSGNVVVLAVLGLVIALSAACFVLPLWGIHERLAGEKEVLLAGIEDRTGKLAAELYRRLDAGELGRTKEVGEAMAAAGAVRDRISRLPTWPWPPQLLRGFLTALLVPVVVYVITRVIGGQIGG